MDRLEAEARKEYSDKMIKLIAKLISEIFVSPLIVMLVWNRIVPEIFGFTTIVYWQSMLIVLLIRLAK